MTNMSALKCPYSSVHRFWSYQKPNPQWENTRIFGKTAWVRRNVFVRTVDESSLTVTDTSEVFGSIYSMSKGFICDLLDEPLNYSLKLSLMTINILVWKKSKLLFAQDWPGMGRTGKDNQANGIHIWQITQD